MAIEDFFKKDTGKGLAIGVGIAIIAPVVLPVVAKTVRPLVKEAIKSGMLLYEKGRENAAELGEGIDDLVAEAKAEVDEQRTAAGMEQAIKEEVITETDVERS